MEQSGVLFSVTVAKDQGSAGNDHPRPAQLRRDANLPTTQRSLQPEGSTKAAWVDFVQSGRICLLHLNFLIF